MALLQITKPKITKAKITKVRIIQLKFKFLWKAKIFSGRHKQKTMKIDDSKTCKTNFSIT